MKWKIEKKYINMAALALIVIVLAIAFNNFMDKESGNSNIKTTIVNTMAPIIYGFVLAYLLNPVLKFLEKYLYMPLAKLIYRKPDKFHKRKSFSRTVGVFSTLIIFFLLLFGGLYMVIPQVYQSISKIILEAPEYYEQIESWIVGLNEDESEVSTYMLVAVEKVYLQIIQYIESVVLPNIDKIVVGITTGIVVGLKALLNAILAVFISVYVLFEKEKLIAYAKKLAYSYLNTRRANALMYGVRYANNVFGGFINGKIIDSFIIGMLCYIFMVIVDFEYIVLISIIVGVTNIIPYFGPFIGAIPSILILLMEEPRQGIIFAIFVLILQQFDGNLIGPYILGDRLKISSMWILFAILVGGGLFGVIGMILGAPFFACLYAFVGYNSRKKLAEKELPVDSRDYLNVEKISEYNEIIEFEESKRM